MEIQKFFNVRGDYLKVNVKRLPGVKSSKVLNKLKEINGGYSVPYPFVMSNKGEGCYFKDIDGNTFLDFGSQIATNPLGYNSLKRIVKRYKQYPIKYAGQDFSVREHAELIEELIKITPKKLNAAFLINSGAEAVENAIKICMRKRAKTKFGVSFEKDFHGRTLGALSYTSSKEVQKKNYLSLPFKRIPFDDSCGDKLESIIKKEGSKENVGFVIMEVIQGEGGYNIASKKMIKDIRKITKENKIPLICDEVQSGMGRTGKWWAFENFNIVPDVISSAKALQVGATISSKDMFPGEAGAISSTWGGGAIIDLALGIEIINIIKRKKLLIHVNKMGWYLRKRLNEVEELENIRGLGLMDAFDLPNIRKRDDIILECLKNGLVLLGCGDKSVRVIPSYVVKKKDIDIGVDIIEKSVKKCMKKSFKHKGKICRYMDCGKEIS
jgi:4-aminobutyrate aminotransferase